MDGIPWPVIGPGSGWAAFLLLVLYIVRAVMRGDWVSKRELEGKVHDANEWRAEGRIKDAQIAEKDRQLRHMREVGRTVNTIMRALQRRSGIEPALTDGEDGS